MTINMERIKKILVSREKIVSYLLAAVIVYLGTYRLGDLHDAYHTG